MPEDQAPFGAPDPDAWKSDPSPYADWCRSRYKGYALECATKDRDKRIEFERIVAWWHSRAATFWKVTFGPPAAQVTPKETEADRAKRAGLDCDYVEPEHCAFKGTPHCCRYMRDHAAPGGS